MKLFFTSLLFLTTIIVNSQTPITISNIQTAINTGLTTNHVDGMCSDSEYGSITEWDVSNVTNMEYLFYNRESFNGNISSWDVSSVTTMNSMFNFSRSFNQDLSNWDVSSVTNMYFMFRTTDSFNQEISSWDVSNVTNMEYMFEGSVFNQDISGWCVTNFSSEPQGFSDNSPLTESNKPVWGSCPGTPIDDSNFQTAVNTCLSTHPITGLCTDSEYGSITEWDVSNVTDMSNAFKDRIGFNGNISSWDVSSVTTMVSMFEGGTSFIGNISNWDVSSVTNMEYMFYNAVSFNRDIMFWDVENVINMDYMFYNAESFNQDISIWCVTNFSSEPESFSDNSPLIESNKPVWGTCLSGTFIDDSNFLTAINTCLTTNPVDGMCSDSEYGAMPTWDVRYVTNMSEAFYDRLTFNGDISSWDVSNVTNMRSMFNRAADFNVNISTWDVSNVTITSDMFRESISFNQNIGNWDMSSVTQMNFMFMDALSFNQDIGDWDVSSVYDMVAVFKGSPNFNQNIGNWDMSSVTDISFMFDGSSDFNQNIGNWDVSSVTNMEAIFRNAVSFNQDISGWCVTNILVVPNDFSLNSPLIESNKPVWGSCPSLGVNDQNLTNISIYPNPVKDKLLIQGLSNISKVYIYNVLGKLVLSKINSSEIYLDNLESGIYIIKIRVDNRDVIRKFIKK